MRLNLAPAAAKYPTCQYPLSPYAGDCPVPDLGPGLVEQVFSARSSRCPDHVQRWEICTEALGHSVLGRPRQRPKETYNNSKLNITLNTDRRKPWAEAARRKRLLRGEVCLGEVGAAKDRRLHAEKTWPSHPAQQWARPIRSAQ